MTVYKSWDISGDTLNQKTEHGIQGLPLEIEDCPWKSGTSGHVTKGAVILTTINSGI